MKQLRNIYQELGVKAVELELESLRLEAQSKHVERYWKGGRRKKPLTIRQVILEFWARVDIRDDDECWEWKLSFKKTVNNRNYIGYGSMSIYKKHYTPSRLAYLFSKGNPHNLHVCHKCDNPPCCNPNHLFLGTMSENIKDCVRKGRKNLPQLKGENGPRSVLKNEEVLQIRELYRMGSSLVWLGIEFQVSPSNISSIVKRKSWKHI